MTAVVVNITAARTAHLLRQNAPPHWIESFLDQMGTVARERHDPGREAFWHEVADLLKRKPRSLAV
jgi:hypothetical protein